MALMIPFKKTKSGEIKQVKLGTCWPLFFVNIFGLVFFIRGVWTWGVITLIINTVIPAIVFTQGYMYDISFHIYMYLTTFFSMWLASRGNELTAKFYLNHGYEQYEPESEETRLANHLWKIHQTVPEGWKPNLKLMRRTSFEEFILFVLTIGQICLWYNIFSYSNSMLQTQSLRCDSKVTIDNFKGLAQDKLNIEIFQLQNITQVYTSEKKMVCTALALTSKGSHEVTYSAEKMDSGGIYLQIQ